MKGIPLVVLAALTLALMPSGTASADPAPEALGIPCTQTGTGSYNCGSDSPRSTVKTWDGTPIDVNVALPDPDAFGDGPWPLVMIFHGYGEAKVPFTTMKRYNDEGYATFSMTDRGFFESCGSPASVDADPAGCDGKYVRLMDARYEVRDAQYLAGLLVDEGLIQPTRIAATGNSYGGGMSMALAVLKDRVMMTDGSLVPWVSPGGEPMALAAAAPFAPWTDLAYSLVPNGRMLDYLRENPYDPDRFGVMKQSITNGLFMTGNAAGRYAPAGLLPEADLAGWLAILNQGEPYRDRPAAGAMLAGITNFHSSYYLDHSRAPAPLLIGAGFTDDVFPVDEALRFYNRTRAEHPEAPITLMLADFGHQRAQNKGPESAAWAGRQLGWINWHLLHRAPRQNNEVVVWTETCPSGVPSGGPYTERDWASLAAGEITVAGRAAQVIKPWGGSRAVATAFGVLANNACANPDAAREPGTANYESDPAPAAGFTMIGSPTVVANLRGGGEDSQIAARLVDVSPDGTKRLVARQLYRFGREGYQVFQLHPAAWTFRSGHRARLELLPKDAPATAAGGTLANYGRPSDGQRPITVRDLVLRIPVNERPGSLGGLVRRVAPKILPGDRGPVALAPGYLGSMTMKQWVRSRASRLKVTGPALVRGRTLRIRATCPARSVACARSGVRVGVRHRGRSVPAARARGVTLDPGRSRILKLHLLAPARKIMRTRRVVKVRDGRRIVRQTRGPKRLRATITVTGPAGKFSVATTVRRTGPVH